jgi:uncharacterized protein
MPAALPFTSALVTGASSGIGQAMARQLGAAGVPTVVVARREERLRALADEFVGIEVLVADLTTSKGVGVVAKRVSDPARPIGLVVNNAGFGTSGNFYENDPRRLANEIGVNVTALTLISRAALGVMVPRGSGYLLNVSSVASFQPAPRLAVYAATKAFVTSLTESLHEEVRGTGVHVTALCPGLIHTEFQSVSRTDTYQLRYPAFTWLDVDRVAAAALGDVAAGHAMCVPGMFYKGLSAVSNMAPRGLARRISGMVQRR